MVGPLAEKFSSTRVIELLLHMPIAADVEALYMMGAATLSTHPQISV